MNNPYIPVPQYEPIYNPSNVRVANHRALNDEDVKHDLQSKPSAYATNLAKTITNAYFSGNGTLPPGIFESAHTNIIPTLNEKRSRQLSAPNLPDNVRAIWDMASGIKYGLPTWMGSPGNFFDPASRNYTDEGWKELVRYINTYGNHGILHKDLTEFGMGGSYIDIHIDGENVIFDIRFHLDQRSPLERVPKFLKIQISIDKNGNTPALKTHWYVNKKEEVIQFSSIAGNPSKNNYLIYHSQNPSSGGSDSKSANISKKKYEHQMSFNIPKYENIRLGGGLQKTAKTTNNPVKTTKKPVKINTIYDKKINIGIILIICKLLGDLSHILYANYKKHVIISFDTYLRDRSILEGCPVISRDYSIIKRPGISQYVLYTVYQQAMGGARGALSGGGNTNHHDNILNLNNLNDILNEYINTINKFIEIIQNPVKINNKNYNCDIIVMQYMQNLKKYIEFIITDEIPKIDQSLSKDKFNHELVKWFPTDIIFENGNMNTVFTSDSLSENESTSDNMQTDIPDPIFVFLNNNTKVFPQLGDGIQFDGNQFQNKVPDTYIDFNDFYKKNLKSESLKYSVELKSPVQNHVANGITDGNSVSSGPLHELQLPSLAYTVAFGKDRTINTLSNEIVFGYLLNDVKSRKPGYEINKVKSMISQLRKNDDTSFTSKKFMNLLEFCINNGMLSEYHLTKEFLKIICKGDIIKAHSCYSTLLPLVYFDGHNIYNYKFLEEFVERIDNEGSRKSVSEINLLQNSNDSNVGFKNEVTYPEFKTMFLNTFKPRQNNINEEGEEDDEEGEEEEEEEEEDEEEEPKPTREPKPSIKHTSTREPKPTRQHKPTREPKPTRQPKPTREPKPSIKHTSSIQQNPVNFKSNNPSKLLSVQSGGNVSKKIRNNNRRKTLRYHNKTKKLRNK